MLLVSGGMIKASNKIDEHHYTFFLIDVLPQSQLFPVLDEFSFRSSVLLFIFLLVASSSLISLTDCERSIFGLPGGFRGTIGVYWKET